MLELLQSETPLSSWITEDTAESLLKPCTAVSLPLSKADEDTMKKMIDWVKVSQDQILNADKSLTEAIGIAAPQIGKNVQMYYILLPITNVDKTKVTYYEHALINPKITAKSNQVVAARYGEGCLSVKNKDHEGIVPRSYKIEVTGYDYFTRQNVKLVARGYEAIVFQHEQDHLEGHLFYHHINQENPWNTPEEWIIVDNQQPKITSDDEADVASANITPTNLIKINNDNKLNSKNIEPSTSKSKNLE